MSIPSHVLKKYIIMKFFYVLFLTLMTMTSFGQIEALKADAKTYVNAVVYKNFDQMVAYTHPNIITLGGGNEMTMKTIVEERKSVDAQAITYISGDVSDPTDIINSGGELHSIITQEIVMEINGKKFKSFTNLLAASLDNGKTWSFVNLDHYDKESLKVFVPRFDPDMVIPEAPISVAIEN